MFPAIDVPRSRRPPPLPSPALAPPIPDARPSERPTLKTLPPIDEPSSGTSHTQVIELSASALDSDAGLDVSSVALERDGLELSRWTRWRRRATGGLLLLAVVVAASAGGAAAVAVDRVAGDRDGRGGPVPVPRRAASEHTPLVMRAEVGEVTAPAGRCTTSGDTRVLATRAHLAPGLEVNVLEGGFGIGFAASADEAFGVRLDGSSLRVADRVRVKTGAGVRHVTVDVASRDDDAIDLAIDAASTRTVVPEGDAPAFRVTVAGGWIQTVASGWSQTVAGGWIQTAAPGRWRTLWPMPGASASPKPSANVAPKPNAAPNASASPNGSSGSSRSGSVTVDGGGARVSDGFVRLGGAASRAASVCAPAVPLAVPELRAAARAGGGAVVALRRSSALWLGLVDGKLAAEGPLVALPRPGASLGMPSVAPWGRGGAVAWAERAAGDEEWVVMVASFARAGSGEREGAGEGAREGTGEGAREGAGEGAREVPTARAIGAGMSPSIVRLPDGELLLAYAVGAAGAHRVVIRRLGRDLEPRGEEVFVSPDALNAGQPSAAVGADGRGLVAFFGAERGQPPRVLATPLSCALGM